MCVDKILSDFHQKCYAYISHEDRHIRDMGHFLIYMLEDENIKALVLGKIKANVDSAISSQLHRAIREEL